MQILDQNLPITTGNIPFDLEYLKKNNVTYLNALGEPKYVSLELESEMNK